MQSPAVQVLPLLMLKYKFVPFNINNALADCHEVDVDCIPQTRFQILLLSGALIQAAIVILLVTFGAVAVIVPPAKL